MRYSIVKTAPKKQVKSKFVTFLCCAFQLNTEEMVWVLHVFDHVRLQKFQYFFGSDFVLLQALKFSFESHVGFSFL